VIATFLSLAAALIAIGFGFSLYSQATNAPVSPGAFNIQGEDLFWVAVVSVIIGAVAVVVRLLRRVSR
jgi:hypothetical protein